MVERRIKPRIQCAYPAIVRGYEPEGGKFEEKAVLGNLSAGGLYLRQNRYIEKGKKVAVHVRFSSAPPEAAKAPSLATLGFVVRSEVQENGTYGLAIKFQRYRFI
jgi:hypothetical protein